MRTHATRVVHMTAGILPGPYRVPAYRSVGHFRLTNKTPAATYRAPGRYETTFVRERLVDAIAAQARHRPHRSAPAQSPSPPRKCPTRGRSKRSARKSTTTPAIISGCSTSCSPRSAGTSSTPTCKKRKAAGELVGIGIAMFVEKSGLGPTDGVKISVDTSGTVEVVTGGASIGQGFETVMAQVAADALGVDYQRCRVIHGQTDRIPFGIGAHASRATVMTASATHIAALNVRKKALEVAAELLQADARRARHRRWRSGAPRPQRRAVDQARKNRAKSRADLEDARRPRPGLSAEGWFRTEHQVYPYGSHVAVVRVDRETGGVHVERYAIAYDIGRAINPALVEGQIVGGFAQGLGGALFEEFTYNERGDPLAVTFADYLLPAMHETPTPDVLLREDYATPLNPLGIKGAGESGITGVGAAIASAIDDAIGIPGAVTALPVTPQRLKALLGKR